MSQAGKEATIVHYDPAAMKLGKGEGFPFRWVGGWWRGSSNAQFSQARPGCGKHLHRCCRPASPPACRTVHFFASADKAKRVLGWQPQHTFMGDVEQLVKDYVASGRLEKEVDFAADDKILAAAQ